MIHHQTQIGWLPERPEDKYDMIAALEECRSQDWQVRELQHPPVIIAEDVQGVYGAKTAQGEDVGTLLLGDTEPALDSETSLARVAKGFLRSSPHPPG